MVKSTSMAQFHADLWNDLDTDEERLNYVITNKDDVMVWLDNDESHIGFITGEDLDEAVQDKISDIEADMRSFNDYFGCTEGVQLLFNKLGVRTEEV